MSVATTRACETAVAVAKRLLCCIPAVLRLPFSVVAGRRIPVTALSEREVESRIGSPNAIRRACLSRHVRLAQVPADHIQLHNLNRLDTVTPIVDSHWDKQCTVCIVSRSMGSRCLRPCLPREDKRGHHECSPCVADRSRVGRSGLPHGLRLKMGIITAKKYPSHLPRLRDDARASLAKKERRLQAKLAVEKVSRVVTALYMRSALERQ